jgi:hypothetical protein
MVGSRSSRSGAAGMIFGFISLVLFGWLLFPRVTGWIIFLIAISLVSALGSSFSFEKQNYLQGDQKQELLDRRTHLVPKEILSPRLKKGL